MEQSLLIDPFLQRGIYLLQKVCSVVHGLADVREALI